jgi:hypothetical protein
MNIDFRRRTMSSREKEGNNQTPNMIQVRYDKSKKYGMNTTIRLLEERWPTSILTGLDPRKLAWAVCFKNA